MNNRSQNDSDFFKRTKLFLNVNFSKKNNLKRLIGLIIAILFCIPISIWMNLWAQNTTNQTYGSDFISIYITTNNGLSFSLFSNNSFAFVFSVQFISTLIVLFCLLFSKNWWYIIFFSFVLCGACFNTIDRCCPKIINCLSNDVIYGVVLDYFKFSFKWGIFNIPDIFISIGVVMILIYFLIDNVFSLFINKNGNKKRN